MLGASLGRGKEEIPEPMELYRKTNFKEKKKKTIETTQKKKQKQHDRLRAGAPAAA